MIYIFKNKLILPILAVLIFVGCGYKETNIQIRDIGYLKFNKISTKTYTVIVNDKYKFILNSCTQNTDAPGCYDDTINKIYEVSSGNLTIKVLDEKKNLIMQKDIFLGSSNTVEINLK